jgi:hypothetical protein
MSATKGLFGKYLKRVFIETGSNYGDGIQQALNEGFKVVYSIEIDTERYNSCVERFKDNPDVHLILGDTIVGLNGLLKIIDEPVTFWLDAHKGNGKSPLMKELSIIGNHMAKSHTILIDDLRDWKIGTCGFDTEVLKKRLTDINDKYKFILEDGYVSNDVLVAYE